MASEKTSGRAQRINIGFHGGQVLAARVSADALGALTGALGTEGWHQLPSEEGVISLDLGKVVYVLVNQEEQRVGFAL